MCRAHSQVRLPSGYGSSVPGADPSRPGDDVSRVFVAAPSAVRAARSWVEAMLTGWGEDTLIHDGTLVASELATNAVHHAGTAFRVSLRHSVGGIRIACEDLAAAGPEVVEVDSDATGGRGIGLVAELSARWGSDRTPSGKVVWAELTTTSQQEELDVASRR